MRESRAVTILSIGLILAAPAMAAEVSAIRGQPVGEIYSSIVHNNLSFSEQIVLASLKLPRQSTNTPGLVDAGDYLNEHREDFQESLRPAELASERLATAKSRLASEKAWARKYLELIDGQDGKKSIRIKDGQQALFARSRESITTLEALVKQAEVNRSSAIKESAKAVAEKIAERHLFDAAISEEGRKLFDGSGS